MSTFDKIVLLTRRTRLEDLVERFNTRAQARFYIEHSGGSFEDYEQEHDKYQRALATLTQELDVGLKLQRVDRSFLPTFLFAPEDLVVTLGQDGLVANCAKYALGHPIVAVNPDPQRFDGLLLPFQVEQAKAAVVATLEGKARLREVTLAQATLQDGQQVLAFNDLFLGAQTHVSARYRIICGGRTEPQSSSGVLVCTGAGSSGWMSSVFKMASGIAQWQLGRTDVRPLQLTWEDPRLFFAVREPFVSRTSKAGIVAGFLESKEVLRLESLMPSGGVIFSDGIEADYVQFNSGAIVQVGAASRRACLVVGAS